MTVFSTAVRLAPSVSLPDSVSSTIGTVPLAYLGRFASSSSVAAVESDPGMVVSSLVGRPVALAIKMIATANTSQPVTTHTAWRGNETGHAIERPGHESVRAG